MTDQLTARRFIEAEPATIFDVLRDPEGHVDIDSSGMLQSAEGDRVGAVGDRFTVHMDREAKGDYPMGRYDVEVVIECTGLGSVGRSAGQRLVSGGIMCLTGIMNAFPTFDVDATALNRRMVLNNQVLFGSVNAGRRHWEQAIDALVAADQGWLARLITRRVPLARWPESMHREQDDVKVVLELAD